MPVFDSKTKTKTRVGIGEDAWKPGMGALGKGSEKDEALIHGNKKEQIDMNQMSTVNLNRTFETKVNFECTVGMMRHVEDNVYLHKTNTLHKRDVTGPSLDNRVGPTMITFVAPLVETHSSPRCLNEPLVRMEQVTNAIKAALDDQEVQGFAKSATGLKMEGIGISMTATVAETFVKGVAAGVSVLEDMTTALFDRNANVEWKKRAFELDIEALETKTGMCLAGLKLAANSISM
jgi:hypothetical protein